MLPTVQVVREHGEVKWGKQFTIYKSPPWELTNVGRIITPPSISSIIRYRSQTAPAGLIFPVAAGNMAQQCPSTIPSTQQNRTTHPWWVLWQWWGSFPSPTQLIRCISKTPYSIQPPYNHHTTTPTHPPGTVHIQYPASFSPFIAHPPSSKSTCTTQFP